MLRVTFPLDVCYTKLCYATCLVLSEEYGVYYRGQWIPNTGPGLNLDHDWRPSQTL